MAWPVASRRAREFKPMRRAQGGYLGAAVKTVLFGSTPNPAFNLPLQTSLNPERSNGSGTPTFTANSTRYQIDHEGKANLVLANEVRFQGSAPYYNEYASSAALATQGNTTIAGTYAISFTGTGTITFSGTYVGSLVGQGAAVTVGAIITTTAGTLTSTVSGTVTNAMLENKTGATNTNPAPFYVDSDTQYGANVNAVRYDSNLNASTIASGVLTRATGAAINSSNAKWASLPGVSGSYFSTPNAAANQITGDIDIRVKLNVADYTPATGFGVIGKSGGVGARAWFIYMSVNMIQLYYSVNGTALIAKDSTATIPAASNGTDLWIRVTQDVDNGAGGSDVTFYTSQDASTWVQLGDVVTTAGAITRAPGTAAVEVGSYSMGAEPITGRIYRAQIYNGINGALAVDFNPNLSTDAQTFNAATGEVWTTNGTAKIYGNTHATYGIPAQWDAGGPYGYLAEGARADVLGTTAAIRRTMTDVGWVNGGTMTVGTATGADGVASAAASLTGGAVAATNTVLFTTVLGSAGRTFSALVRRKTGTGTIEMTDNGGTNWTDITAALNTSTYVLRQLTRTQANPIVGFRITTNGDAIEVDFNTIEAASFANPTPIPVNVSKAADVLTYLSAGNFADAGQGAAYAEWYNPNGIAAYIIGDAAAATKELLGTRNNLSGIMSVDAGSNTATGAAGAPVTNAVVKGGVTFSGSTMRDFINGVGGTATTFSGTFALSPLGIGNNNAGTVPLFGTIRTVRIWPVALSSAKM